MHWLQKEKAVRRFSWLHTKENYQWQPWIHKAILWRLSVPAVQGLWETGRRGCHWYPATSWVLLRDMWMEEKAEAVQERSMQRNTNFRVLPRGDPSNGEQESEYTKQTPSMLPVHHKHMEEKAEAVQERSVQRNTNFRVLPRREPSNGDEKSE